MNPICPVCLSEARFYLKHPDADLFRCPSCTHCFSNLDTLRSYEYYTPEYYSETHKNWFLHTHGPMFDFIHEQLVRHRRTPQNRLLDVGCGNGNFLRFLAAQGWPDQLTGIDLSPNEASHGIEYIEHDFFTAELGTYDLTISIAAIEHIEDARDFVDKMIRCRTPDGVSVVITLNEQSLLYKVAHMLRLVGIMQPFDRLYDVHHLNHFTRPSLTRLIEDAGGQILESHTFAPPIEAMDMPAKNSVMKLVQRFGVSALFALGDVFDRNYLQSITFR